MSTQHADAGKCLALLSDANSLNASAVRVLNASAELGDGLAKLAESIDAVVSQRDALGAVLDRLVNVIDAVNDNSEGKLLSDMVSYDCRGCTANTSPRNIPCAYHAAKALLKAKP